MQLFLWTEADTGFLTDGAVSKSILFGGLLLALLLFIIMSAVCKNFPKTYKHEKNFLVAVTAALAGISVILRSVYEFYEIAVLGVQVGAGTFTAGHPAFYVALSILGLFAAMTLFVTAGNFASGHSTYAAYPLFALILPLWHCYNLIIQFVSTVSGASVMENALEVLTLVFALLFLFFQAKLFAGLEAVRAARRCFMFGMPAVLFSMMSSLPVCVLTVAGIPIATSFSLPQHIANLCLALYILCFLAAFTRTAGKRTLKIAETPPPQPPVAEKSAPRSIPSSELGRPFHSDTEPPASPITGKLPPYGSIGEGSPHPGASRQKADASQQRPEMRREPASSAGLPDDTPLMRRTRKPEDGEKAPADIKAVPLPEKTAPAPTDQEAENARRARLDRIDRLYESLIQERTGKGNKDNR